MRARGFWTWLRQMLCGHGYTWIAVAKGRSGCHWCGKIWRGTAVRGEGGGE